MKNQHRHPISFSLDDELILDIYYACGTSGNSEKVSREIENILRREIPSRKLSMAVNS